MVFKLHSRQNLDFVPQGKTERERVTGCKLFYTYNDPSDRYFEGLCSKDKFFRIDDPLYTKAKSLPVPCEFEFGFEFNGSRTRITDIILKK